MLIARLLGTLTVTVETADSTSLVNALIKEQVTLLSTKTLPMCIELKIYFNDLFKLKSVVKKRSERIEKISSNGGISALFFRYKLRYGIMVGFLVSLFTSIYLSNIMLEVKIYGADEQITQEIMNVLSREGVTTGVFLPAVDRLSLECEILENTSTVALVNSRTEGSALCLDIKMIDEAPQIEHERLSADIVATKDGTITSAEVFSGNTLVSVGEEVKKGDVLVSGEMTLRGKLLDIQKTAYFHSSGKIYADFDQTITFYVPFEDTEMQLSDAGKNYFLNFFSVQIPTNPFLNSDGLKTDKYTSYFNLFGIELPLGITTASYKKAECKSVTYTEDEAFSKAYERIERYEENVLADEKILSKLQTESVSDSGVTVVVTYRLNGEIGMTKEILKK